MEWCDLKKVYKRNKNVKKNRFAGDKSCECMRVKIVLIFIFDSYKKVYKKHHMQKCTQSTRVKKFYSSIFQKKYFHFLLTFVLVRFCLHLPCSLLLCKKVSGLNSHPSIIHTRYIVYIALKVF